jgi:hypothetical protein
VQYVSEPILDAGGKIIGPNEVASWKTSSLALGTTGYSVPAFDIAYNGLIYPDNEKKQSPSQANPLPFFWSTQASAKRYQLRIWKIDSGSLVNPSGSPVWQSNWTEDPALSYTGNPGAGNYGWEVLIDAGNVGQGTTRLRSIQF